MTRAMYRFLDEVPSSVRYAWEAAREATGEDFRVLDPGPGQSTWIGAGERSFVRLPETPAGQLRVLRETRRLRWAAEAGIPVPQVVAATDDGAWLVTERVPDDPPGGPEYVRAAVETSLAFSSAPPPSAQILERGGRSRARAPRPTALARAARLAAAGVPARELLRARRRAAGFPRDTVAHGDFHPGNLLFDAGKGLVRATDLENLGLRPAPFDISALWCGLEARADRESVIDTALGAAGGDRRHVAALLHLAALKSLADVALVPAPLRDPNHGRMLGEAKERAREAQALAARWGAG